MAPKCQRGRQVTGSPPQPLLIPCWRCSPDLPLKISAAQLPHLLPLISRHRSYCTTWSTTFPPRQWHFRKTAFQLRSISLPFSRILTEGLANTKTKDPLPDLPSPALFSQYLSIRVLIPGSLALTICKNGEFMIHCLFVMHFQYELDLVAICIDLILLHNCAYNCEDF